MPSDNDQRFDNITKQDLKDMQNTIIKEVGLIVKPIIDDVEGYRLTLYGKDGRNGLVGDANKQKGSIKVWKYLSGTSFAALLTILGKIIYDFINRPHHP